VFPDALISQGKKLVEGAAGTIARLGESIKTFLSTLTLKNIRLFDKNDSRRNDNENAIAWILKNLEKLFVISATKDGDETENRVKRDLEAFDSGVPRTKPHLGGISEHVLKLSEGSTSNVLKSEKATVAEALNGRAAIRKILARAKAKAAQAQHRGRFYDNDDFSKWLLPGSSFDANIFRHHRRRRPFYNAKMTGCSETETSGEDNNDDNEDFPTFAVSRHMSAKSMAHQHRHQEMERTFNSDPTIGAADSDRPYTKLRHKSKRRKHPSPELEISRGGKRGHETNGILYTSPRQMHGSLSREEAESAGRRYVPLHARIPHSRFRVTEDEETENGVPKWKHTEWMHAPHPAGSFEFDTADEKEDYKRRYLFETSFDEPELELDGSEYARHRKWHEILPGIGIYDGTNTDDDETTGTSDSHGRAKLGRKRYRYSFEDRKHSAYNEDAIDFANAEKQWHSASSLELERASSINSRDEGEVTGDQDVDAVERSAIWGTSAEMMGGAEKKQSGNTLIKRISTDTPTRKPVNIDSEHYRTGDRSVAANSATSFSSSLSDGKESRHTNNMPASPSVDDGSAVVKTKTENDGSALRRAGAVIDNDAMSTEIEMGFRKIKDHPSIDSPSIPRAHSRTHLDDQSDHRDNVASSEAKLLVENRNKTRDLKKDQEIENTVSSREVQSTSVEDEHQRDLFEISSSSDSREEDYVKSRKGHASPRRTAPRHRTSIEVIDIEDRSAQVLLPEFPVLEFGKRRTSHDIGYYDPDAGTRARTDQEIEIDGFAGDSRSGELDYDDPDEKEESANNAGTSKDSEAIVSDGLDRQGERRKNAKHVERHGNCRNKFELNQHDFHQRNMTSSSTVWNATRFATWEEYLYFIQEQKRKSNALNLPVELSASFAGEKNKERNNVMDGEISPSDERGEKHMTDEDNRVYVKERESIAGLIAQSTGINEITTSSTGKQEETEMRNTSDQSKNRKIVTYTESLSYNGTTLGTTSQAASSKITIDSNVHRQDDSWESLNNSRVDVQAEAERVYGTRGGNKNTDVIATQAAETAQSTDPKSNLERVSPETSASESDNTEKMVASEQDERVFSPGTMIGYIHHDDSRETSASSVSAVKSQMEVKHHLNGQSKNAHGIDTETSSNDSLDEFGSNAPNTAAFSGSFAESRIGSLKHEADMTDNKRHDVDADATISISIKNQQTSTLANTSSSAFSTSSAKEEINNLNRLMSTKANATNLRALPTAESATRTEKQERRLNVSGNARTIINAETSSTTPIDVLKNEESISSSKIGYHLTDQRKSKDAVREAEGMHSNAMKDRQRFHLRESISSVESSQTLQTNSDNHRDSRTNVLIAENIDATSRMVAPLSNAVKGDYQQQADSLSSSSTENENKANVSMSITISNDIIAISQRDLIRASSLQTSMDANDLNARNDDSTSDVVTLRTLPRMKDDNDGQENNKLNKHAKWLIDPRNKDMRKFANDIERVKFVDQDSGEALNIAASAETVLSTDIKSARNSAMSSSSIDGATEIWPRHKLDQAKERKTLSDDSIISKASSENEDNYKIELLEASSLLHNNASEERSKHHTGSAENYRKSMVAVEAPPESVLSRSEERSRDDLVERISDLSGEAQRERKNFDVSEDRSEVAANKMTTEITSSTISVAHRNNLSRDTLIWNERVQANERLSDENKINTANSDIEDEADSQGQAKDFISKSSTKGTASASSSVTGDTRDDLLKVRASDNLHAVMFQDDKRKLDVLSDPEEISNVVTTSREIGQDYEGNLQDAAFLRNLHDKMLAENESNLRKPTTIDGNKELTGDNLQDAASSNQVQEKKRGDMRNIPKKGVKSIIDMLVSTETINGDITDESRDNSQSIVDARNEARWKSSASSINAETRSDIDRESSIFKKTEAINFEIRNNINKWHAESGESFSSSLSAGLQNEEQTAVYPETAVSAESIDSVVNKDVHKDESVRANSPFGSLKIAQVNNDRNRSDQRTDLENIRGAKSGTSSSNVSKIEHQDDDVKGTISVALNSRQHDINAQTEDKAIISNVPLSTDGSGSNEMHNARQKSLDTVTSSNSHAEAQRGISDIAKENWEIAGNAATSAILSGKVTGESREKLITSWSGFNSFANPRMRGNNDPNVPQKEREVTATSAGMSTNSAISRNWENARWNRLTEKNYESVDLDSDTYVGDEDRNVSEDNIADTADASASEARHVIRDKQQSDVTAEAWTRHEYDSSFQRESAGLIRSDDAKDRVAESKNTLNNAERSLKAAAHTVMSTDTTSSADIRNASKLANLPKILPSSDIPYAESKMDNAASRDGQNTLALTSSISAARNAENQREIENNDNVLKEDPYDENAATSGQSTNFGDAKKKNNLLKAMSSAILFADTQRMQQRERESNVFKEQRLINIDSTASSDSRIFEISSGIRKDLEELTGTSSSDSHARSSAQSENHAQVLRPTNTLASQSTDTISEMLIKNARQEESSFHIAKDENLINMMDNSMNENSDIVINDNAKTKPISSTVDSRLLNLLNDAAVSVQAKDGKIFQKDAMTEESSKQSAGLASAARNTNLKISNGNYEDSATMTETESNLLDDRQNVLYKVDSPSSVTQNIQRDIESTSSANPRAITQLVNQSTARSEDVETNRKEIVNSSILGEAEAYSRVKGTDPNDWSVARSGIAALAEERAHKKDRSDTWKEAEQAAVYAETSARAAATTSANERRDVCTEDPSRYQDGWDAAKNILDVVVVPGASGEAASTGAGDKNENKSFWVNGMAATSSSSDDAHAETRTIDEERHGVSRGPELPVDAEETSAASASISDNVNAHLGRRYDQINDETSVASTVTAASKNIEREVQVPFIETSLHPAREACDENVGTREFISAASSLYKVSKQHYQVISLASFHGGSAINDSEVIACNASSKSLPNGVQIIDLYGYISLF